MDEQVFMQVGKYCNCCGTDLVYDADGSLSGYGWECWYCPDCFWYTEDWNKYPRPVAE